VPDFLLLDQICLEYVVGEKYYFSDGEQLLIGESVRNKWLYEDETWKKAQVTNSYIDPYKTYSSHWSHVPLKYRVPEIRCLETYE
jgi:hypothetical protein